MRMYRKGCSFLFLFQCLISFTSKLNCRHQIPLELAWVNSFFYRNVHPHFNGVSCVKCSSQPVVFFFVDLSCSKVACLVLLETLFALAPVLLVVGEYASIRKRTTLQVFRTGFVSCKESFPTEPRRSVSMRLNSSIETSLSYRVVFDNFQASIFFNEPHRPKLHPFLRLAGKHFSMELCILYKYIYIIYLLIAQFGYSYTTKWTQPFVGEDLTQMLHPSNKQMAIRYRGQR